MNTLWSTVHTGYRWGWDAVKGIPTRFYPTILRKRSIVAKLLMKTGLIVSAICVDGHVCSPACVAAVTFCLDGVGD